MGEHERKTGRTGPASRRGRFGVLATALLFWGLSLSNLSASRANEHGTAGPWELVRSDEGIEVFRRTVHGSPLHEFQGTGVVEAPITSVLAVLDDADHRLEWMAEAVAQTLISRAGDRDAVIRALTTVDVPKKVVQVAMHSVEHPNWPPQKGVVRMPHLCGHWYLWPTNGGKWTRVEYQVHADPGGSLPTRIINLVSKKIPHNTIAAIKRQVVRRKYPEYERKLSLMPEYKEMLPAVLGEGASAPPAARPAFSGDAASGKGP